MSTAAVPQPCGADVAVKDGIVAAVGDLSSAAAAEGIDITGLHLCPGFIDSHCHTDTAYSVTYPGARGKVMQGLQPTSAAFAAEAQRLSVRHILKSTVNATITAKSAPSR